MEKRPKGKSLEAFRKLHDKNNEKLNKVKEALVELGDSWEYEAEFIRRCGLSNTDFAKFREEFKDHWFEARCPTRNYKRVWCGTRKFAQQLKEFIA